MASAVCRRAFGTATTAELRSTVSTTRGNKNATPHVMQTAWKKPLPAKPMTQEEYAAYQALTAALPLGNAPAVTNAPPRRAC
jgi:hypothetical protein